MTTLALPEALFSELCEPLDLDVETAAVIIARRAEVDDQVVLLARRILWVPDDAYLRRERLGLEIASSGYVPALKVAADDGAVAIFFHTHPGGDPKASQADALVDAEVRGPFQLRTGQPHYGSLILAGTRDQPAFSGRHFIEDRSREFEKVRVVGSHLRLLTNSSVDVDEALFDRQIRSFGREGQQVLSALHVGIVGVGGTGSAVFEQLVRLGVSEITLIDDDVVTRANLTRIHEAREDAVGKSKVDVAKEAALRIGLGTKVRTIARKTTDLSATRALTECDVIFGCTDDNRGRATLSRLAYWYLIPVFDTAFLVDTDRGAVRGLFARVTTVMPGTACLFCRNRIDQAALGAEALPHEERVRLAAEGYVPGLGDPDPSVGAYTTFTGALAVHELLDRLFGFSGDDAPSEVLARLHDRMLSTTRAACQPGHYCGDVDVWGRGDTDPVLEQLW